MLDELPPSFDPKIYCQEIGISMTDENAWLHYVAQGKQLGAVCSIIQNENDFLNIVKTIQPKLILEIGPGAHPRMIGDNVEYYDVHDSNETVEWAKKHNYNISKVPKLIHHVSKHADMSVLTQKYDIVFSSHNIEHQIDIINHIQHIERILKNNGYFVCIVPNKKFTFDYYKNESTIYQILNEHIERPSKIKHSFEKYANHRLCSAHNNPKMHWDGFHGERNNVTLENLRHCIIQYLHSSQYEDIHSWIFSDDSFEIIFINLFYLNITNLKLIRLYRTIKGSNSFFAIFKIEINLERNAKQFAFND